MVETLKRCGPTQSKSDYFQNSKISPISEQPTIHCQAKVKSLQWLDAVKIRQLCKFSAVHAMSQILCCWCMSAVLHTSLMPFFVQILCCMCNEWATWRQLVIALCVTELCAHRPVCSTLVVDLIHATPPSSDPTSTRGVISYSVHSSHCDTS